MPTTAGCGADPHELCEAGHVIKAGLRRASRRPPTLRTRNRDRRQEREEAGPVRCDGEHDSESPHQVVRPSALRPTSNARSDPGSPLSAATRVAGATRSVERDILPIYAAPRRTSGRRRARPVGDVEGREVDRASVDEREPLAAFCRRECEEPHASAIRRLTSEGRAVLAENSVPQNRLEPQRIQRVRSEACGLSSRPFSGRCGRSSGRGGSSLSRTWRFASRSPCSSGPAVAEAYALGRGTEPSG